MALRSGTRKITGAADLNSSRRANGTGGGGEETEALSDNRKRMYQLAEQRHPERWDKRATRNWDLKDDAWLSADRSVAEQLSQAV